MRMKILALSIVASCLASSAVAGRSVLSQLPDSTVQRLREGLATQESPAHWALGKKMNELRGQTDLPIKDARTVRTSASSSRQELAILRDAHIGELRQLRAQLVQAGAENKVADVDRLIHGVTQRFDRLDAALGNVERGSDKDLKAHHGKLRKLLAQLTPAEAGPSMLTPMMRKDKGGAKEAVRTDETTRLPQYVMNKLREMMLAQRDPRFIKAAVTPEESADCNATDDDIADDGAEVRLTPEVQALAKQLAYSPAKILRWMMKEVEFDPYWGSLKGSLGVLQTRRGNSTDQASLLVALLRASKIPARFVNGAVSLSDPAWTDGPTGRMQRFLGTKNYGASLLAMTRAHIPANMHGNGVAFNHVWVTACVPYAAYRGSRAEAGGSRWIPMDPSIKDHDFQNGISVNVPLDDAFYTAYLAKRTDKLVTEYLADKAEAAARVAKTDASRKDIPYEGTLKTTRIDVLSGNTPAALYGLAAWTTGWSSESAKIPDVHRYKFSVALLAPASPYASLGGVTLTFPQDLYRKITVSYTPDTASQSAWNGWGGAFSALPAGSVNVYPQVNVDGVSPAGGKSATTVSLGSVHRLAMKVTQGNYTFGSCIANSGDPAQAPDSDTSCVSKTVYDNLKAGGYFALAVNANHMTDALLEAKAKALSTTVNGNATPPTPANAASYDATVGQLLDLVVHSYIKELHESKNTIGALRGFKNMALFDLGLTGSEIKTAYVFDLPLTVKPAGVYVDFKGGVLSFVKLQSAYPASSYSTETAGLGKLAIAAGSALEHRVWQEALRVDAVSTIRGLQFANESGTPSNPGIPANPLRTFTQANIGQYDSQMTMSGAASMQAYKAAITSAVNDGATVTVPQSKIAYTDPVEPTKAWRGAVYLAVDENNGSYSAAIDGGLSGGYPLLNSTPITSLYNPSPVTPTFQNTINSGSNLLTTLTPGVQGSNPFATWVGDPVNMLTGNFTHHETDFKIKGRGGLPIILERWYNSGDPKDGPFGFGWTHSLNHMVKLYGVEGSPAAARISWVNGSGGENFFSTTSHAGGDITKGATLTNPAGVEVQFTRVSGGADDGKFKIRERDGTVYLFASATGPNVVPSPTTAVTARLLSITDRNGNALTLNYTGSQLTSVSDSAGRTVLTFTWTGTHITEAKDVSNRKVIYAYNDGNNNLNQVTDTAGGLHKYSYYTLADGTKLDHHIKRHTLPRGNGMEFAYYSGGQVFRHTPFDTAGALIPESAMTFHYNLFSRENWSVNGRGQEHRTTFDANGNPLRIIDESGAAHTYTYDTANPYNRLTETDSIGRVTTYTYTTGTQKNLVDKITSPSGAVQEFLDYNAFAQPQRVKDARGNWVWRKYDATGNLTDAIAVKAGTTTVAGTQPAASTMVSWTKFTYDTAGNLTGTTRVKDFAAGTGPSLTQTWDADKLHVASLTRQGNWNGAAATKTTPTFVHDALGRVKSGVDAQWYPVSFTYDGLDRITAITDASGRTSVVKFDANGNTIGTELLHAGARVDAGSAVFDAQDRIAEALDHAGNRAFFKYDAIGNRIAQTSPDNYTLGFEYDGGNRPVAAFDAEGNRVYTSLDSQGRPLAVTDPNGNTVTYQYHAAAGVSNGRLKRVTQPRIPGQTAGRSAEYDYDAAGNVIRARAVAADGTTSRQSFSFHDELGRAVRTVGAPSDTGDRLQVCSKYDNLSNLTEVWAGPTTDTAAAACNFSDVSLKRQVTYEWDDFGNRLKKVDALNRSWIYAYDDNGNLVSSQTPEQAKAGLSTTYAYDARLKGTLKAKTVGGAAGVGQTVTYTRNPLGKVTRAETRDGAGALQVAYDYGYDRAHRLSKITDSRGGQSLGYTWTPGGRLSRMTLGDGAAVTHQWDYKYDAVGRLSTIVAPNGQSIGFLFDAAGRLVERRMGIGLSTQYAWLPEGSLSSLTYVSDASSVGPQPGGASVATLASHGYKYDNWGNRYERTDVLGGISYLKTFTYDGLNRLKSVDNSVAAQKEAYGFDIFGNLTSKTVGNPVAQTWTYGVDDAHQLNQVQLTAASTTTTKAFLRYDDNGNLRKLCEAGSGSGTVSGTATDCGATGTGSAVTTFDWDGLNQLAALARSGTAALNEAYAYDDIGRRVRKTSGGATAHFLYDGEDVVGEWSGAAIAGAPGAIHVHGTQTDDIVMRLTGASGTPDAGALAYAQDGVGSVSGTMAISGSNANVAVTSAATVTTAGDTGGAGFSAAQLKDGITTGSATSGWQGTAPAATATLALSSATTVDHIELMADGARLPKTYAVDAWDSVGGIWRQVATGADTDFIDYDSAATKRAVKSFAAITTTSVRVRFTSAVDTASNVVRLSELQLWRANVSLQTQRYGTWGDVQGASAIPAYGFAGREPDASNLVYMRARYYHPVYGRFISRDPMGLASGISSYQYADGDPISLNDPQGLLANRVSNTVTSYAGQAYNTLDTYNVGTRVQGALQLGAGMGEVVGGAALGIGAGWTGIGAVGGAGLIGLGVDNAVAGYKTLISGQAAPSLLDRGMDSAGVNPLAAAGIGMILSGGANANAVSNAAQGAGRLVDAFSQAAGAADRGGLTAAGRALQKHGGREGSAFPGVSGGPGAINKQGQFVVDDILTSPGSATSTRHHARFGEVTEIRAPDGRGLRYGPDGKFIGFLEPN